MMLCTVSLCVTRLRTNKRSVRKHHSHRDLRTESEFNLPLPYNRALIIISPDVLQSPKPEPMTSDLSELSKGALGKAPRAASGLLAGIGAASCVCHLKSSGDTISLCMHYF